MVDVRLVNVDLPEPRQPLAKFPETIERVLQLDLPIEGDLSAGKKAHGDVRLANCSEAAGNRVLEPCRHQLVSDLRRSGRDVVQAVVAHDVPPLCRETGVVALGGY